MVARGHRPAPVEGRRRSPGRRRRPRPPRPAPMRSVASRTGSRAGRPRRPRRPWRSRGPARRRPGTRSTSTGGSGTSRVPRSRQPRETERGDGHGPAPDRPGVALGPRDQERERGGHEEAPPERCAARAVRSRTGAARPDRRSPEPLDPPVNDSRVLPGRRKSRVHGRCRTTASTAPDDRRDQHPQAAARVHRDHATEGETDTQEDEEDDRHRGHGGGQRGGEADGQHPQPPRGVAHAGSRLAAVGPERCHPARPRQHPEEQRRGGVEHDGIPPAVRRARCRAAGPRRRRAGTRAAPSASRWAGRAGRRTRRRAGASRG